MKKALLDTNFVINLVNKDFALHQLAVDYFKYFLDNKITMFLSTIVVGEFCVKGSFDSLPTRSSRLLSYNLPHSKVAGRFANVLYNNNQIREIPGGRKLISNDVKLLAQTSFESIDYFVSSDRPCKSLFTTLATNRLLEFRFVDFSRTLDQNFPPKTSTSTHKQSYLFDFLETPPAT